MHILKAPGGNSDQNGIFYFHFKTLEKKTPLEYCRVGVRANVR